MEQLSLCSRTKQKSQNKKYQNLDEYNWDDGLDFPRKVVSDSNCDLALALEVFDLADGYSFLQEYPDIPDGNPEWIDFVKKLMQDILAGKYPKTSKHYEVDLSKVQKYKLSKLGVPEVFLQDV